MKDLAREDRMLLLKFVCSFAWADLVVRPEERDYVAKLVRRLGLDAGERKQVEGWLKEPPPIDEVDPALVPKEHRQLFVKAIESVVAVDGEIDPAEREQLILFAQLLRS